MEWEQLHDFVPMRNNDLPPDFIHDIFCQPHNIFPLEKSATHL